MKGNYLHNIIKRWLFQNHPQHSSMTIKSASISQFKQHCYWSVSCCSSASPDKWSEKMGKPSLNVPPNRRRWHCKEISIYINAFHYNQKRIESSEQRGNAGIIRVSQSFKLEKNNYQTKSTMYTISAPPTAIKTREMIEIKWCEHKNRRKKLLQMKNCNSFSPTFSLLFRHLSLKGWHCC